MAKNLVRDGAPITLFACLLASARAHGPVRILEGEGGVNEVFGEVKET